LLTNPNHRVSRVAQEVSEESTTYCCDFLYLLETLERFEQLNDMAGERGELSAETEQVRPRSVELMSCSRFELESILSERRQLKEWSGFTRSTLDHPDYRKMLRPALRASRLGSSFPTKWDIPSTRENAASQDRFLLYRLNGTLGP
jgi:hypothetical protein